jgi:membrane-bound lytic murein transglycosylase D
MQSHNSTNSFVRGFLYTMLLITGLCFTQMFSGCSGSEDEPELTRRETDSILTYSVFQESFGLYKKALAHNEAGNTKEAAIDFESALKKLRNVNAGTLSDPLYYNWKKDYEELAVSIVQDFLTTQSEIDNSSIVFDFAGKLPISYEKIEHVQSEREPMPEGVDVPLERNSVVDEYIEFFSNTDRGRSFIDKCLYRGGKYFPLMRSILKANNAPEELIYLSVQESGLSPTIVSRAGAVGLWQFMPATGAAYELYQDDYRDDRRDFEKATDAAARHLKDLYKSFDDWYLAFAAYNAGPGRIRKAISKSGSKDFWTLRGYLPGETKNYVPSIIALSFVLRDPAAYGFSDVEMGEPISFDRVDITASMSLQKAAEFCETDIETIRDLNPELKNDEVPMYDVGYQLRIPHNSFDKFAANYKASGDITKGVTEPVFAGSEQTSYGSIAGTEYKVRGYIVEDKRAIGTKKDRMKVVHDLRPDQGLPWLSTFYEVRPIDIRLWNNLSYGSVLNVNQKLDIYLSHQIYDKLYGEKDTESQQFADNNDNSESLVSNEPVVSETAVVTESTTEVTEYQPEPPAEFQAYNNSGTEEKNEVSSSDNTSVTEQPIEQTTTDISSAPETTQEPVVQSTETVTTEEQDQTVETTTSTEYESESTDEGESVNTTSNTSSEDESSFSIYEVQKGDNLSMIANSHNVSVEKLKSWNGLSDDKILVGQKLKVKEMPQMHIVSEGENLSMIAGKYGMSLGEIKQLNDLNTDVIVPGQKLMLSGEKLVKTKSSASNAKVHTVRKGETLAEVASKYGISVSQLKQWNGIKNDKIMVGQVLKVTGDSGTKKVRKKK